MVSAACAELGLPAPASTVSTADTNAVQFLALANREGKECSKAAGPAGGWQELRAEYTFNVQSTGIIPNCSYTSGSYTINIGTPPTQAPQVGWVICSSGGSNATAWAYPTTITHVAGSVITVNNPATSTSSGVSMAFGEQSYALPTDYDFMIPGTMWDRGYRWQIFGPLTPQEWQVLKSGLSPTGPRRRYRIMNGLFYLDPIPYDSNLLVFEYYSVNWCMTGGTTPAQYFTSDTDTYLLEDDLMILGLQWRWKRAKGLDYSQEYETYTRAVARELGHGTTSRTLRMDISTPDIAWLSSSQIPDTGFGTGSPGDS